MDASREQLLRDAAQASEELVEPVTVWGSMLSPAAQKFFSETDISYEKEATQYFYEVLRIPDEANLAKGLLAVHNLVRGSSKFCDALASAECVEELMRKHAKFDKAATLLSAVMCRSPSVFIPLQVSGLLESVKKAGSDVTLLEVTSNLLKFADWRHDVWAAVGNDVLAILTKTSSVPVVYKALMCIWLASFTLAPPFLPTRVVAEVNNVLSTSRTEKVVRIALLAIENLLKSKAMCEEMAECETIGLVTALEYEKWRDAEMPELIKTLIAALNAEVKLLTNFERFEREVTSGALKWGFIHTEKFWLENVLKCEGNNFRIIDLLMAILKTSASPESLAVACHDIGEFARLHPVGKQIANTKGAKEKMLELMSNPQREVAREALLCVQKLMLVRTHTDAAAVAVA